MQDQHPQVRVIAAGGGLDTASIISHQLRYSHVDAVYHVNYGQRSVEEEWRATNTMLNIMRNESPHIASVIVVQDTSGVLSAANPNSLLLNKGTEPFIRGRNLHILNLIASAAIERFGADRPIHISLGLCLEDMMFDDADETFVHVADNAMNLSWGRTTDGQHRLINIEAPLSDVPKILAMHEAVENTEFLMGDSDQRPYAFDVVFDQSFTCWTPIKGNECGTCAHCTKKARLKIQVQALATAKEIKS